MSKPLTLACLASFRTLGQEIHGYEPTAARSEALTALEKSRLWIERATKQTMIPVDDPRKAFEHGQPGGAFKVLFESLWTEFVGGYETSKEQAEAKTALRECYLWISAADAANQMTGDVVTVLEDGTTEVTLGTRPIVFAFDPEEIDIGVGLAKKMSDVVAAGEDTRRAIALIVAMQHDATQEGEKR